MRYVGNTFRRFSHPKPCVWSNTLGQSWGSNIYVFCSSLVTMLLLCLWNMFAPFTACNLFWPIVEKMLFLDLASACHNPSEKTRSPISST